MVKGEKVQRVIEKYDLKDLGDELVDRWTDSKNAASLHELEQYINKRIVQSIVNEQLDGLTPQNYPPKRIAYLLRADGSNSERFDDASQVEIVVVKNWSEENEIDTTELTTDLVSYNTVYEYLINIQEVNASERQRQTQTGKERQKKVENRLLNLQHRVEAVTQQGFESLVNVEVIPESYDIRLQFRIECTECDRRQDMLKYIRNSGCTVCDAHSQPDK